MAELGICAITVKKHKYNSNKNVVEELGKRFKKVNSEISIAFFSYNLKRVINILGAKRFLGYLS